MRKVPVVGVSCHEGHGRRFERQGSSRPGSRSMRQCRAPLVPHALPSHTLEAPTRPLAYSTDGRMCAPVRLHSPQSSLSWESFLRKRLLSWGW